jgi:hypothetical protein
MRKTIIVSICVLAFCSGATAQFFNFTPRPSWLLDYKRLSMNHSVNFSYSPQNKSFQTLYNNYFMYSLSPKFTFIGNVGYCTVGLSKRSVGNYYRSTILHGLGFEYRPHESVLIRFQYEGMTPLKKGVGSGG